jgi:hypothetical protein
MVGNQTIGINISKGWKIFFAQLQEFNIMFFSVEHGTPVNAPVINMIIVIRFQWFNFHNGDIIEL